MRPPETAYLYDEPGPRTRRRIRIASVVSLVVLAGALALMLRQFASRGQLDADRWSPFLSWPIWEYLLVGLRGTLLAAAVVAVLGGALGVLLALGRLSPLRPLRWLCTAFIEVFRTLPVLLLIYLMLFGLPAYGINLPVLWKLVVPLTVANSAAIAEIVRAGVLSLPRGQTEAGYSLGMRRLQVMRAVVLPQALRAVTPSLVVQLVSLLKDTSLGYVVAFTELLYRAQVLSAYNRLLVQTFLVVTLVYLVVNGSLSALASRLKRRTTKTAAPVAAAVPAQPGAPAVEAPRA
ncbi:glutamate transport system permease protein [Klenkia marina]|uniref:Glutamate transport system permease protein n=1 Tax=Klenkia marina TaxID=1960309 RepID=A0A1G4Y812_9ACTN|nr:amino acid ABC transporter permease [Klenkia marina]SCX49535.1 glutamate transport system permease protein [Klenkia marina]